MVNKSGRLNNFYVFHSAVVYRNAGGCSDRASALISTKDFLYKFESHMLGRRV